MRVPGYNVERVSETERISREFDEDACDFCDRYEKRGLSPSSKILFGFIRGEGVRRMTVVDLGCGAGSFSIELLKEGAESAFGVDLSPRMIESANQLATANGFESRAKFSLANAATAHLPVSDIVVMDKILCCYSDWHPLLKNAIDASGGIVGFIVPRDEGLSKWTFRIGVRLMNIIQKRRGQILFYLHPLDRIDRTLRESGFELRRKKGSRFWLVFLYSRDSRH